MNILQLQKIDKQVCAPIKRLVAITVFLMSVYCYAHAQPQLFNNLEENFITISAPTPNLWEGVYRDFRIPDNPITEYLHFRIRGGDGGEAKTGSASTAGGGGAVIEFDVKIGNGPNEIPAGSTLRFMVGKHGQGHTVSGAGLALAGGGGGTGILLPGNGSFDEILAIAGGGGGAYRSGTWGNAPGQGGRSGTSGGDGQGGDGADGGTDGNSVSGNSAGSGGAWFNGGPEGGIIGGAGIYGTLGWGGETGTGGNGGYGCGGGGGASLNGFIAGAGGGGGYSSGGGAGGGQTPVRAGGGGSYLNTDYAFNSTITAGGASQPTEHGIVRYQFYCSARFANNVTVTRDAFCFGTETIQLAVETPQSWCPDISYKRKDNNETNTTGLFAGLQPGTSYTFELYYDNELVDEVNYTVSSVVDDESPIIYGCGSLEFDIRQTPNPVVELDDIYTGATDDCGINSVTIVGYGDARSFSCDDPGDHILTVRVTDHYGNASSCRVTVSINNAYPSSVGAFPLIVELDENGEVQISEDDIQFNSAGGSCFTFDEIYANYQLPAAYRSLNCDDLGVHYVPLEEEDPNFPDVTLELTVEDNIPITASVANVTIDLDASGVGTLSKDDLSFTVGDNCFTDAEIIAVYSLPAEFTRFDCMDIGTFPVTLDKSDASFPSVIFQVTVQSSALSLPPVSTDFCTNSSFDLTSLEDQITTASGTFSYSQAIERLYIPNTNDNTVSVVDLATNTVITTIAVGASPGGVAVRPDNKKVYITNQVSGTVSVIDVATNTVETSISVGDFPTGTAFNSDGSRLYVTNLSSNDISVVNTATNAVVNTITAGNPWGIALNPDDSKIYVANQTDRDVSVINANTGAIIKDIPVQNLPHDVVISADGTKVYIGHSSGLGGNNTEGAISSIDISTDAVVETLFTDFKRAHELAVHPNGNIYVALEGFDNPICRVEPSNGNAITYYDIEDGTTNGLRGIDINDDGSRLYLPDRSNDKVIIFNTLTNTEVTSVAVGNANWLTGTFYVKTSLGIASPSTYTPSEGDIINVAFYGGGDCAATTTITLTSTDCQTLAIKANLEGAYNTTTGLMNASLRNLADFPTSQGHFQIEEGVLEVSGNNAIVDWVTVSLRDALDNTAIIFTRPALLQADGDVVDMDGTSPIHFQPGLNGTYYVVIDHRNHLGLMTANTQAFTTPTMAISIDFTSTSLSVFGNAPRVELEGGIWGCFAADADGSGAINASDRSMTWNNRNQSGYLNSDCNLDGTTNANDRSAAWNNRNKGGTLPE